MSRPQRSTGDAGTARIAIEKRRQGSGQSQDRPSRRAASGEVNEEGVLKRTWKAIMDDDVMGRAAQIGFFAFLSFPPAILVLFAITGFFGGEQTAAWLTSQLSEALPEDTSEMIDRFVDQVVYGNAPGPFSVGALIYLWAASNVFVAIGDGLNRAYEIDEPRSWVKRRLIAVAVMLAAATLLLVGSAVLLLGPYVADRIELYGAAELAWMILQWPLAFTLVVLAFFIIYYVLPARDQSVHKMILLKSSAAAAALWILATVGFRIYVANFASYQESYGFLGAVIVFLIWLWVTGIVILVGGELNSEWEAEARA